MSLLTGRENIRVCLMNITVGWGYIIRPPAQLTLSRGGQCHAWVIWLRIDPVNWQVIKFHSWESVTKSGWHAIFIFFIVARAKWRVGSSTAVGSVIKGAFNFNLIKNLNIQITKRKSFQNYAYTDAWSRQTDRQTNFTCTTALAPLTSSTCPLRWLPSANVRLTISANLGNYNDMSVCTSKSQYKLQWCFSMHR